MKNSKKMLSGILALTMMAGLTACGGGGNDSNSGNAGGGAGTDAPADTTEATTTTTMGVDINTETLKDDEQAIIDAAAGKLPDAELANTEIKWLSNWDINPDTSGKSKPLELELFETKYGGSIKWYPTQWATRFTDLSNYVLGGEGIDFFPYDTEVFPNGAVTGMIQPVDDYIDYDSELWSPVKAANDQMLLGGKHYMLITGVTADNVCIYNRKTIEDYGLDDPAELYAEGNWTWDTFKQILTDYCNPDEDRHGIDGWWAEKAIMLTTGVPCIGLKDGKVVSNVNDPNMERVMNFMYDLYQNNLVLNKEPFGWAEKPEFMGEGKEMFYPCGLWALYGAPEIWTTKFGAVDEVMFVPMPKDPEADKYYLGASMDAFVMCKGAANPEGLARFMDCKRVANTDEGVLALGDEKLRNDYGWTDEMIAMQAECHRVTRENPVFDVYTGVNADLTGVIDSGENGVRSAMRGIDWATTRETIADFVQGQVDDFNTKVEALS